MAAKTVINSDKGLKSPLFSQAIIHSGTVYVSGNIGADYTTMKLAGEPNDVYAQTVSCKFFFMVWETSALLTQISRSKP
jgi:enamine deaminase RidA (YjgF/YER057c/UK114 family)